MPVKYSKAYDEELSTHYQLIADIAGQGKVHLTESVTSLVEKGIELAFKLLHSDEASIMLLSRKVKIAS